MLDTWMLVAGMLQQEPEGDIQAGSQRALCLQYMSRAEKVYLYKV